MASVSKQLLSSATGGRGIKVVATATPGTTLHATGISAAIFDELWLWVANTDSTDRQLTLEFGGTTSPDDLITITIAAKSGLILVVPGLPLVGDGTTGRSVTAFAATANAIVAFGYVNRIT